MSRRSDEDAEAWHIWLRIAAQIDRAAANGIADLRESAWRVLALLSTRPDESVPIDIDAISRVCSLSTATVSRALADLEEVDFLRTRPSNQDGRLVDRVVTAAGRHALGKIYHASRHDPESPSR